MAEKIAYIFPGQGAQVVGMGRDFYDSEPLARQIFDKACKIAGYELTKTCFEGPEDKLNSTTVSQPAIFVTSVAILEVLKAKGIIKPANVTAGLSLGEYTALYARSQFNNLDFLVLDGYKIKKTVFYEKIYKYNPDILGISFTTQSSTGAYEIINKLKSYYQDKVLIIAGGPHPSIGAEEVFEKSLIDYVVRGEGEIVFSDIIRCCSN